MTRFLSQALLAIAEAEDQMATAQQGRLDAMAGCERLQGRREAVSAELVELCASRDSAGAASSQARSHLEGELALLAEANQVGNCSAACAAGPSFPVCTQRNTSVDCSQGRSSDPPAPGSSPV